ncbi:MAG: methyltransferase domain-containing protein [Saprospiraceae bacterium]|nr:methyltransferase domain-containing protein [Saprospiraceae bacterium]
MESPKTQRERSNALEEKVRDYYDDNTKLFLKLGAGGGTRSIHQPLFMRPEMSYAEAMHAQHALILHQLDPRGQPCHVLDLGCGVGASLLYLADNTREPVTFTGITLSPRQAVAGHAAVRRAGLERRITIRVGSFLNLPADLGEVHLAFAIESLIHATDLPEVITQLSRRMAHHGRLVIFDDFLRRPAGNQREKQILHRFRNGWQGYGLCSVADFIDTAVRHGFSMLDQRDLTGYLRLNRPRDRWIRLIAPVARLLAPVSRYCTFLVGGNARQSAYQQGLLQYMQLVLRYDATTANP